MTDKPIDPETRAYMIYALGESGDVDASRDERSVCEARRVATLRAGAAGAGVEGTATTIGHDRSRLKSRVGSRRTSSMRIGNRSTTDARLTRIENDTEATALSLKALLAITPSERAAAKGRAMAGWQSAQRLLLGVDQADGVRDLWAD